MLMHTFRDFQAHAFSVQGEACGVIVADKYVPCRNLSSGLEQFSICPEDYDAAEDKGRIQAICHSHKGPRQPSKADLEGCKETGLPWYILGDDGLERVDSVIQPFEGRVFEYGWTDCFTLVRDYLGYLPDFPREIKFWEKGISPYEAHFSECGWGIINPTDAQAGDVFLMRILSRNVPNHVAVCLGAGVILHHLWGRLSCKELWGPYMSHTTHVLRRLR